MMQKTEDIRIEDFNYPLPDNQIAKFPVAERDHSKLLLYRQGVISEERFDSLPEQLPAGTTLVFNNTKVIRARLHFRKETGALIEIFCLEPHAPSDYALAFQANGACSWSCLVGNLKKWKEGTLSQQLTVKGVAITLQATRQEPLPDAQIIHFQWDNPQVSFAAILEELGELPIPPYLNRKTQASDLASYQTVYSKIEGSVAAPTAGLHFTPAVLEELRDKGVNQLEVTLHVGAGTFKPVKSETIAQHPMHTEFISVSRTLLASLLAADSNRIVAVGTTSVRTMESLYHMGQTLVQHPDATPDMLPVKQWQPYHNPPQVTPREALEALIAYLDRNELEVLTTSTQIMIAPGYQFQIVKGIVTNFHQPQSTLLLLVSAFVEGNWREIYDYALSHNFRFLSYGDSSLLLPRPL